MQRCAWLFVVGLAFSIGCDEEEAEVTAAASAESGEEAPEESAEVAAEPAAAGLGPSGTHEGEPFVVRGVLAKPRTPTKIEVRLFSRAVSCESYDDDYELSEGEKVVVIMLEWPRESSDGGETITLGASNTSDFFQFCHGRASGNASCIPRAQAQGSLTVVEPNAEGASLSFDVESENGALSGDLAFTLCD